MFEVREPSVAYGKQKLTEQEYLVWEAQQQGKHEFFQGEIFAMSGASVTHNVIYVNLLKGLFNKLDGKPCQPYGSDLRIHIPRNTLYTYPDISIICKNIIEAERNGELLEPVAIFEILSPSTKQYDRGGKFKLYRDIPALREFVVIDSESLNAEVYHFNAVGDWSFKEYSNKEEEILLPFLNIALPLSEIYRGTNL